MDFNKIFQEMQWRKVIHKSKKKKKEEEASRALIYLIALTKFGMRTQGRRRKLGNKRSDETASPPLQQK